MTRILVAAWLLLAVSGGPTRADVQAEVYETIGLPVGRVLNGTVLSARVRPGPHKQVVAVTTHFTGKRDRSDAVTVRLDVFDRTGDRLRPVYSRDFGADSGVIVGRGDLQIVDLDADGVSEIIVSWDDHRSQLIDRRDGEVIFWQDDAFRTGWSGTLRYDATRAAREVPSDRRDRYRREIDFQKTMRTRGVTLFFQKTVIAVAGERLPQPKQVQETFGLKQPPASSR